MDLSKPDTQAFLATSHHDQSDALKLPYTNSTEHPPRENNLCRGTNDSALPGHNRPPDTQDRSGDTLMGGVEAGDSGVNHNSENSQQSELSPTLFS